MTDYPRKRAALGWLERAANKLAMAELGEPLDTEDVTASIEFAQDIIRGTDTQQELPTMTAKNEPDTNTALATLIANAVAQALAAMPQAQPTAKPKSALPEESKPTAKALTVTLAANRATASTVVYSVADHSVLWADRGLSIDRKALESIGNPQSITVTITAK